MNDIVQNMRPTLRNKLTAGRYISNTKIIRSQLNPLHTLTSEYYTSVSLFSFVLFFDWFLFVTEQAAVIVWSLTTMTALSSVLCRLILRTDMTGEAVSRTPCPLHQSPIFFFTRPSNAPRLYTSSNRNVFSETRLPIVTSLSSRIFKRPRMASVTSAKKIDDDLIFIMGAKPTQ